MSNIPTRLLRTTLQGRMQPAAPSGCINAETLGAWSDGMLSARERVAAESHASGCARCQALLAAMARTMPPAPPTRWWRPSTMAWVAPLAVAAAAVVLWIYVPRPRFESFAPPRVEGPAPAAVASAPTDRAPAPTAALPTVPADRLAKSKPAEQRNSPPPPPEAFAPQRAAKAEEPRSAAATGARPPAERQDQANTAMQRDAAATRPEAAPSLPRAEERPLQPFGGAVNPKGVTSQTFATAKVMSDEVASALRAEARSKASAGATEILSPDANVRWRILPGGSVGRSIDGGTTWQTQSTGVPARLTAGSAPSPTICWLVGPGGVIVLSTDARGWQRVPFPEAIDLASVRASDGANATVTAADGQTFTTIDGGKTWRSP